MTGSDTAQRAMILDIINEAAQEIYESKDLPGCLRECYVLSNSDQELALPSFIGELRAVRRAIWNGAWNITDMRPRYHARDWVNTWKNWRDKGVSAIQTELTNAAPLTVTIPTADSTVVVTVTGETVDSNRAVDTIIMSSASVTGTKSFTSIKSITKNKVTDYNLTISDADGTELATLYADQKETRYKIVDISQYPDIQTCPDNVMEVLYKERLNRLENDADEFPVNGFDDVIIIKALQLLLEGQEGKEDRALLAHQKAEMRLNKKIEDKTGTLQKKLGFKEQKKFGIFRRRYYGWR